MLLYHSTDEAGKIGIEAEGFTKSNFSNEQRLAYLADESDDFTAHAWDGAR